MTYLEILFFLGHRLQSKEEKEGRIISFIYTKITKKYCSLLKESMSVAVDTYLIEKCKFPQTLGTSVPELVILSYLLINRLKPELLKQSLPDLFRTLSLLSDGMNLAKMFLTLSTDLCD